MGVDINEDGTKGFVKTAIRGGDLGLIAAWHGADDPTAANNKIPANGLFLNTTERVIKLNIGTEAAPVWKNLSDTSYGNSEIDKVFAANENIDSGFYRNLTINEGVEIKGNTSVLVLYVNDTLTINGALSQSGIDNPATRNLNHRGGNGGADGNGNAGSAGSVADILFLPLIPSGKPLKTDIVPYSAGNGGNGRSSNNNAGVGGIGSGAIYIFAKNIVFGANGSISASGTSGTKGGDRIGVVTYSAGGGGGGAGGIIIITTPTALTADQKAKIISGNSNGSNGANGNGNRGGRGGDGGKARLVEFIV